MIVPPIVFNGVQCGRNTGGSGKGSKSGSRSAGGGGEEQTAALVQEKTEGNTTTYSFDVDNNKVDLEATRGRNTDGSEQVFVDFTVNGQWDTSQMSSRSAIKTVLTLRRIFRDRLVGNASEGTIFAGVPYSGDGRGANRQRAYEALGFGKPNEFGLMRAIVRNGKLSPV